MFLTRDILSNIETLTGTLKLRATCRHIRKECVFPRKLKLRETENRRFFVNLTFRIRVELFMEDLNGQLVIVYAGVETMFFFPIGYDNGNSCQYLTLPSLNYVHTIELNCVRLTDLHPLQNLNTVIFMGSFLEVPDMKALRAVKCIKFIDTAFPNLNGLESVESCTVQYNGLGKTNRTVHIRNCPKITDYSMLKNLHAILLEDSKIEDVFIFKNIKSLRFSKCPNIVNVSCLGNADDLHFYECGGVEDVSGLGKVKKVYFGDCQKIKNVSALGTVNFLILYKCNQVTDVSALGTVRILHIFCCAGVSDVHALRTVDTLAFSTCYQMKKVFALNSVRKLSCSQKCADNSCLGNDLFAC